MDGTGHSTKFRYFYNNANLPFKEEPATENAYCIYCDELVGVPGDSVWTAHTVCTGCLKEVTFYHCRTWGQDDQSSGARHRIYNNCNECKGEGTVDVLVQCEHKSDVKHGYCDEHKVSSSTNYHE